MFSYWQHSKSYDTMIMIHLNLLFNYSFSFLTNKAVEERRLHTVQFKDAET